MAIAFGKWFSNFAKSKFANRTDKQSFLLDAQRAGFEPEATFEQILQAFRSRCRTNFEGVFDGYDCALMKSLQTYLMLTSCQIRNNGKQCGWLDGREYTRGKSGLLKATVPGNARAG